MFYLVWDIFIIYSITICKFRLTSWEFIEKINRLEFIHYYSSGPFLSGMWFSLSLVGGAFELIGYMLPFAHAVGI